MHDQTFGHFDYAELGVRPQSMPYQRVLLYHAAWNIKLQAAAGKLRDDIPRSLPDFNAESDFSKRPNVLRWLQNT